MTRAVCSARSRYRLIQYKLSPTRESIGLAQHPGILTSAASRRVHHQRTFSQSDAGESAGYDRDLVAEEYIRPKIHVPRLDCAVEEAGSAREMDGGLRDVIARIGFDAAAELLALFGGAMRADQHAVAAGFADCLYDVFFKLAEYVSALRRI